MWELTCFFWHFADSIPQKIVKTEDLAVVFSQFNGFREAAHCQHSGSQSSDDICLRFQVNVEPVNQLSNYLSFKRIQPSNQPTSWTSDDGEVVQKQK